MSVGPIPRIALSIRQPWAHHICCDGKDVENRTWSTRFRGWVLIHAGKVADGPEFCRALGANERGGIVGVAEIVDCVTAMDSAWFVGPFGFVLRNARPLPFIPCRGRQGIFQPEIDFKLLTSEFEDGA